MKFSIKTARTRGVVFGGALVKQRKGLNLCLCAFGHGFSIEAGFN